MLLRGMSLVRSVQSKLKFPLLKFRYFGFHVIHTAKFQLNKMSFDQDGYQPTSQLN
jgi:hypothetical protein